MPLDRRIARAFGLDEITLRGSGEAQDNVVAPSASAFSDKVYISYEQGIGAVASNLVKMDYSLSRRWSLRAETGTSSGGGRLLPLLLGLVAISLRIAAIDTRPALS
jgi:autotransporter translocation and assembly factor TamB